MISASISHPAEGFYVSPMKG